VESPSDRVWNTQKQKKKKKNTELDEVGRHLSLMPKDGSRTILDSLMWRPVLLLLRKRAGGVGETFQKSRRPARRATHGQGGGGNEPAAGDAIPNTQRGKGVKVSGRGILSERLVQAWKGYLEKTKTIMGEARAGGSEGPHDPAADLGFGAGPAWRARGKGLRLSSNPQRWKSGAQS